MHPDRLETNYAGRRAPLFGLALWSSLLTILTLGIYRFWMKTRLRRYYWSAIRPGGIPLEYVGEPLEKLLGFLIAVTFMAFYIGIVNLILMFLSFSIMQNNFLAYGLSLVGILPVLFYARYRARRYILARTRWRGVRFGMVTGAWGYSWRALVHWALTILSAGLLWPRMTFWLEKYRADRTVFGTETFHQGGHWTMLYRPFTPIFVGMVLVLICAAYAYFADDDQSIVFVGLGFGLLLSAYGVVHFRVHAFRILMNNKTLGAISFESTPRPWRVFWIYGLGYGLVGLLVVILVVSFGIGLVALLEANGGSLNDEAVTINFGTLPVWVFSVLSAVTYFGLFLVWGTLRQVLVTLPLARHYAETLSIKGAGALGAIGQRDRDELDQAEGFAEALDVGAAI